jgi:hypothetical protein
MIITAFVSCVLLYGRDLRLRDPGNFEQATSPRKRRPSQELSYPLQTYLHLQAPLSLVRRTHGSQLCSGVQALMEGDRSLPACPTLLGMFLPERCPLCAAPFGTQMNRSAVQHGKHRGLSPISPPFPASPREAIIVCSTSSYISL